MILIPLFLLACFPDIRPQEEERFIDNPQADHDEDGYTEEEGDCNDRDDAIHPEAEEVCDGLDNDCNGEIDDNPSDILTFYRDADEDGFGIESDSILSCTSPDGYIEEKERLGEVVFDCNDDPDNNGALINPDALEVCDELDNDCNGQVDEVDNLETNPWYRDNDGDGYGYFDPNDEDNSIVFSCTGYPGLVQNILDCDDTNDTISPDAIEQCDSVDNNCNGAIDEPTAADVVKWYRDADEDGFGSGIIFVEACTAPEGYIDINGQPFDCNDNDEDIFPDAVEVCDGVDNNCNVLIDEGADSTAPAGASTFYADFDGDGFGNVNVTTVQCSQPNGYVTNIDDCNDGNDQIHPNADEYCNAVDDNCNGQLDEGSGVSAPVDAPTWYIDTDGDLSGSISATLLQCAQPSGYVANMDDCDDTDAGLNNIDLDGDGLTTCAGDCNDGDPSASSGDMDGDGQTSCNGDCDDSNPNVYLGAPELCNNFQDDDCDGQVDESDAIDKTEWFEDLDGDGFGNGSVSQLSCLPPSGYVAQFGDCNDNDILISPDADEICDGADNNCDGLIDDADANLDLNTATEFFSDGDIDGQGDPNDSVFRCTVPPGFVTNNTDCDDTNPSIYDGALEYCNGLDDDCDGTEDENAEDAIDYYVDADSDGHGAPASTPAEVRCPEYDPITSLALHPTGLAPTNTDCDDTEANISPSAPELCSNNIDENCDGHNTAGATDVSTFLVDADSDGFGSGERDSNGDLAYALDLCVEPFGYILYEQGDALDCDDGDFDTKPGAQEICNGKRDDCPTDGDNSVPVDEWDDDGDGFVECVIDSSFLYNPNGTVNAWENNQAIYGGLDCEDDDANAYPDAPELCNGAFENCSDPDRLSQNSPDLETDNDSDCFVECAGFDVNTWEGGIHTCERVDSAGQVVQEVVVVGGEDCNDDNADTYIGAAFNAPLICAQDSDADGEPDCNLTTSIPLYTCDYGLFPTSGGEGPDFRLITGGLDPTGTYTLTHDFYVMTTEVSEGMWDGVMGTGLLSDEHGRAWSTWYDGTAFANALSTLTGKELCYVDSDPTDSVDQYDILDPSFATPYECEGYRLLTEAEWEYASRSGSAEEFWTPNGGGTYSFYACEDYDYATQQYLPIEIVDGSPQQPLVGDYAWFCGNRFGSIYGDSPREVGRKLPNGFGLYDMAGGMEEWMSDGWGTCSSYAATDPYCPITNGFRMIKGGDWAAQAYEVANSASLYNDAGGGYSTSGFRVGITY